MTQRRIIRPAPPPAKNRGVGAVVDANTRQGLDVLRVRDRVAPMSYFPRPRHALREAGGSPIRPKKGAPDGPAESAKPHPALPGCPLLPAARAALPGGGPRPGGTVPSRGAVTLRCRGPTDATTRRNPTRRYPP